MTRKHNNPYKIRLYSYINGFIMSLILTVGAYMLVVNKFLENNALLAAISIIAILQLVIQLLFFLHLGEEPKPRWNLQVMLFAVLVLVIIVFGSL